MAAKPAILSIADDPVLNRTRRMILEKYADVSLARSLPEAATLLSARCFDLVLLCYSLSMQDCRAIVSLAHGLVPPPKVLALAQSDQRLFLSAPDQEFSPVSPADLLRQIALMTGIEIEVPPVAQPERLRQSTPSAIE